MNQVKNTKRRMPPSSEGDALDNELEECLQRCPSTEMHVRAAIEKVLHEELMKFRKAFAVEVTKLLTECATEAATATLRNVEKQQRARSFVPFPNILESANRKQEKE